MRVTKLTEREGGNEVKSCMRVTKLTEREGGN